MLWHDSCCFELPFICHNHHGENDNILCINYTIKIRDRPGTGAKPVKAASFFIKTGFSFCQKSACKAA